jgi:hypothetical protein
MIVHADQAREDRVAGEIDDLRARRHVRTAGGSNGLNSGVRDDERLIFGRGAPEPSITRTCCKATTGADTRTYFFTSGESAARDCAKAWPAKQTSSATRDASKAVSGHNRVFARGNIIFLP